MNDGGGCLGSGSYGVFPQYTKLSYLKKIKNKNNYYYNNNLSWSHERWNYEELWKHIFINPASLKSAVKMHHPHFGDLWTVNLSTNHIWSWNKETTVMSSTLQPNKNTHVMSPRPAPFNTVWQGQRSFKHLHICLWLTKRRGEQWGSVAVGTDCGRLQKAVAITRYLSRYFWYPSDTDSADCFIDYCGSKLILGEDHKTKCFSCELASFLAS